MLIKKLTLLFVIVYNCVQIATAQNIPTPKEHFGFNIGDNYMLATFTQTEAYFKKLGSSSEMVLYRSSIF